MAFKRYPPLVPPSTGGPGAGLSFPLIAPPGAAGSESYRFSTGGGLHGTPGGGLGLSVGGADAIAISAAGDASIAKQLTVAGLASLLGGVSTPSLSAGTASIDGNASIGGSLGLAGSAQIAGDLSARKITASADLSAASLSTVGPIAGASLSITGKATLGSLEVKGTFKASSIASDGPLYFPTTSTNLPGLALFDQQSTGIFGAIGTLGLTVAGQVVATFDAQKRASFNGALSAASLQAQSLTADTLSVTGQSTLAALAAQAITATGLSVNGSASISADLTVGGTARLGNLLIDQLSTDHDLSVGGNAQIAGTLRAQGATTLVGGLSVQGPTSLATFSSGRANVSDLRIFGGSADHPPVLREPIPGQSSTNDYVVVLSPAGDLSLSGDLLVLGKSHLTGAVVLDGALSAQAASFAGAVQAASASLVGALQASQGVFGGVTFQAYAGNPEGQVQGKLGDEVVNTQTGEHYLKMSGAGTANGWAKTSTSASSLTFPLQAPDSSASTGPSYAFVSSAGDGLGSEGAGTLYLAVGNVAALAINAQRKATFSADLTVPGLSAQQVSCSGALSVGGNTQLAGLSAGASTLGTLSAQATTLAQLSVLGTSLLSGDATLQGNAQVGGVLGVAGALSSQTSVQAALLLVGLQRLTSGDGNPNGQVAGNPGDLRGDRQSGAAWIKTSGTGNTGWARLTTSADGTTFPLLAPDGQASSPSYGFSNQLGLTVVAGKLAGIAGGQVGWTLATDLTFALAGALSVAGQATLAGLSATSVQVSGALSANSLSVAGSSTLAGVTAQALSAQAVTATSLSVSGPGSFTGQVAAASFKAGPSTWTAASAAPAAGAGTAGDFASIADAASDHPFVVRVGSTWKQVALVGDAAPTQFPLRGPADSAAAPNFVPNVAYVGTGMFSAGVNMLGFATSGVQAGNIDAQGNWTFAKNIAAAAAALTSATISTTLSVTGNASFGGTVQITGAVTLASTLNCADLTSSGRVSAAQGTFSGALSAQSLTTTADVTVGGNLIVNGNTTYNGIAKSGYIQTGDGTVSAPAWAFTSEPGLGAYKTSQGVLAFAAAGANTLTLAATLATFAGAVRIGNTNAGLTSSAANTLALQTAGNTALSIAASGVSTFAFQAVHVAGTAAAPGVAVGGSSTGLYSGTDLSGIPFAGIAQGGNAVAYLWRTSVTAGILYGLNLGDPASTNMVGGIRAGAYTPVGNVGSTGGQLFQWLNGGPGQALWVHEGTGTGNSSSWAKVLTTSSVISPTFPLQSPTLGSAASPTYGYSVAGYTGTGFFAVSDAGGGGLPAAAVAAGGACIAYFDMQTASGLPVYNIALGNPAQNATPYNATLRTSAQSPSGNVIGAPGQLFINNTGGAGSVFSVKEVGVGTSTGWALGYTQGSAQIAGQAGSAAAPYHSFSNSLNSGFFYTSGTGVTLSVAGNTVFNIGTVGAVFGNSWVQFPPGNVSQPSVAFSNNGTTGFYSGTAFSNPSIYASLGGAYFGGFVRFGSGASAGYALDVGPTGNFANGGLIFSANLPNGFATTSPGTLYAATISGAGSLWLKETGSQTTTGYAQVLTTSTQLSAAKLAYQSAVPAAIASVGQVYSLTSDGNLYYENAAGKTFNLSQPTGVAPATNTAPASTVTTTAADAMRTFLNNGTTVSNVTLYTVPAASDYVVSFVVGNTGGFSITAPNAQVIYVGATPTTASNISSATAGSTITLSNPGGLGTWYATNLTGAWQVN